MRIVAAGTMKPAKMKGVREIHTTYAFGSGVTVRGVTFRPRGSKMPVIGNGNLQKSQ